MKIIVISDTHNRHKKLNIPESDMIIHCGDFSHNEKSALDFLEWYSSLKQKYKLLIAGNHDFFVENEGKENFSFLCRTLGIIYLQDESIKIEGVKFYGSPWSCIFGDYPFMEDDLYLDKYWQQIPEDVEVLITHGPQYLIGDEVNAHVMNPHVGSKSLSIKIKELKNLKYHLTGHIHESAGIYQKNTSYITINASMWEYHKKDEVKEPVLFEI